MAQEIKETVKSFVVENFLFGDTSFELGDDMSFIDNDIIDSTGVLELVAFIEEQYNFTMDDAELVPANLDTLNNIAAFVAKKTASQEAA